MNSTTLQSGTSQVLREDVREFPGNTELRGSVIQQKDRFYFVIWFRPALPNARSFRGTNSNAFKSFAEAEEEYCEQYNRLLQGLCLVAQNNFDPLTEKGFL